MIHKVKISKAPKGLLENLQYYNIDTSPSRSLKKKEAENLFEEAKDRFFNFNESKWPLKPCLEFINLHNLAPHEFIVFFEHLFSIYFENKTTGQKIACDLIKTLKTSKKFNSSGIRNKRIQLQKDANAKELINAFKDINSKFLEFSQEDMVKFIFKNINTGYTYSTLRRIYMDNNN